MAINLENTAQVLSPSASGGWAETEAPGSKGTGFMFIPSLHPFLAAWLRLEARGDDLQASWPRRKQEGEPESAEVGDGGLPQAASTFFHVGS